MMLRKEILNIKLAIIMVLLIPIFFGFRVEYLLPFTLQYTFLDILIIIIGSTGLLFFGYFAVIRAFQEEDIEKMRKHEVVNAFVNNQFKPILITFLVTMILEELIFRFYIIGLLDLVLYYYIALIIASCIFSLYHIHIWFSFKSIRILGIYLLFSFLLGLLNGFVLFKLGLFCCILIHYLLVLVLYWKISQKFQNLAI